MDRDDDGSFLRLANRLTRRPVPDFPRAIQIQTVTGCNADCVFCPYGATHDTQPRGRMAPDLFSRILDESAEHGVRRISPYLMNEPLLDREIVSRIREINRRVPDARVVLTTNGHYLTPDLAGQILELGEGLHEIYVSVQGIDPGAYEKTMRGNMRLGRTVGNVLGFAAMQRLRRQERPKLWVTMVDTALVDVRAAVQFWRSRGISSKYTTLENRGGHIRDADDLNPSGSMEPYDNCPRPFRQAYILFNGDMVLCCVDYSRTQVLGNVARSSVREVWNDSVAREIRGRYIARDLARLPLCGSCTIHRTREIVVNSKRLEVPARVGPT